ncbi:nitroreductase/quinone reductase family protein [Nocardia salmonicida]
MIKEFRSTGGNPAGVPPDLTIALLTTTGARSGKVRVSPLMYIHLNSKYYIVGSNGAQSEKTSDPGWVHNLRANPAATAEIGTRVHRVTAREIDGDEHRQVLSELAERTARIGRGTLDVARAHIPAFELVGMTSSSTTPQP